MPVDKTLRIIAQGSKEGLSLAKRVQMLSLLQLHRTKVSCQNVLLWKLSLKIDKELYDF